MFCKRIYILGQNRYGLYKGHIALKGTIWSSIDKHSSLGNSQTFFIIHHVCRYACMYVCMYACMYACVYACMYVCKQVCICVCMYVCDYRNGYICTMHAIPHAGHIIECIGVDFWGGRPGTCPHNWEMPIISSVIETFFPQYFGCSPIFLTSLCPWLCD